MITLVARTLLTATTLYDISRASAPSRGTHSGADRDLQVLVDPQRARNLLADKVSFFLLESLLGHSLHQRLSYSMININRTMYYDIYISTLKDTNVYTDRLSL